MVHYLKNIKWTIKILNELKNKEYWQKFWLNKPKYTVIHY